MHTRTTSLFSTPLCPTRLGLFFALHALTRFLCSCGTFRIALLALFDFLCLLGEPLLFGLTFGGSFFFDDAALVLEALWRSGIP